MVGRYIKYDKDNVASIKNQLSITYTLLDDTLYNINLFCSVAKNVPEDKIYKETDIWDDIKELYQRVTQWDFRNAYKNFKAELTNVSTENSTTQSTEKETELKSLKNAVEGLVSLIDEFDLAAEFNLTNEYAGKSSNVVIKQTGDTSTIYYLDENGEQVTLSQLLNCFYTYSGMAISTMLQEFLECSQNGVPFDAEYQMGLLDQVNGTVDALKDVGAFGVASEQDIIALNDALVASDPNFRSAITVDGNGNLVNNVGGNWTSNMEAGSMALIEYPLSDYVNEKPLTGEGEGEGDPEVPVGPGTQTGGGEEGGGTPTGPSGPTGIDETTPGGPEETLPGGEEQGDPEQPSNPIDIELLDTGGVDGFEGMLPKMEYDYDDLARQMFEGMSDEELMAFREQSTSRAMGLIDANDVDGISAELSGFGYSDKDIGNFVDVNNGIVKNPDAVVAAIVAGDQNSYMANMANNMAKNDGVTDFTSSHGSNASYSDHKSGKVNANIANMHDDEEVDEKSKQYQQAKGKYKDKGNEVNEAAEEANEALAEVKAKEQEYGSDTSKWTEEQAKDYNDAKENYQEAKENYDEKVEEFKEAEQEYNNAKDEYDQAKENFENEIKENVQANEEFYENQPKDEVEVNVGDDDILGEVSDTGEPNTEPAQSSDAGTEGAPETVDTSTSHEGTVNNDGTVSASDQGLLDAVGGSGDAGASEGAGLATGDDTGLATAEGDVATAASESGPTDTGLASDGGSATGEVSTEPNNGIDDLRDGVDTPDVETSGMTSETVLESAPASESGIITEDNTVEMANITEFSEGLGSESAATPEVVSENNVETSTTDFGTDANNNDAAIAAQMASEEAAAQKQKTSTDGGVDVSTDFSSTTTSTAQTASMTGTDFRTNDGVLVESSGNENVVTVGNDAIMDSIRTE